MGVPAFPISRDDRSTGMDMRDWFAGQALVGLVNVDHGNEWGSSGKEHGPICARKAYRIADAMMAQRAATPAVKP